MMRSSNTSSSRFFIIIGSSGSVAQSISQEPGIDNICFMGRSNPHGLSSWVELGSISNKDDVSLYVDSINRKLLEILEDGFRKVSFICTLGVSTNDWDLSVAVNQYLPLRLSEVITATCEKWGNILDLSFTFMGTAASYLGGKYTYSTTKSSLTGLVHSINRRTDYCVRANIVIPGAFEGAMISDWDNEKRDLVKRQTTVNKIATSQQIAHALVFTAQNEYIADSIINMTAGQVIIE